MTFHRSWSVAAALGLLSLGLVACDAGSPAPEVATRSVALLDDPPTETRLATTGEVAWARFGASLAVDGDVLVSAAPGDDLIGPPIYSGGVFVFTHSPTTDQWTEQKKLLPDDLVEFSSFGAAVAVSGDLVAVSLPADVHNSLHQAAAVYVFERDRGGADQWGRVGRITDAVVDTGGDLGTSLALAGDLLAARAVTAAGEEMVMVFERHRGGPDAWGKVATLLETDIDAGGRDEVFGSGLAFDGDQLLVAAPPPSFFSGDADGSAYLFGRDLVDRDRWTLVTRLAPTETGARNDGFGGPVALAGDTAVVGARYAEGNDGDVRSGAAYVFRRDPADSSRWTQVERLTPADGAPNDDFGASLALDGDAVVVGASDKWVGLEPARGAAYLFRRGAASADLWTEELRLTASDGVANDWFGAAVALHGDTAFVGAPRRDGPPTDVHDFGAVYAYDVSVPPPPPCQPASPPTDTLEDGGTVGTPSGFAISAPAGTLTAPIDVWLGEVPAPVDVPLTSETPVGSYYEVGARCTTVSRSDTSFVIELPVPAAVDPTRLAAAVLVPPSFVSDGPGLDSVWSFFPGTYDAARAIYTVTMVGLATEGLTFVLVELDAPVVGASRGERLIGLSDECPDPPRFQVTCLVNGGACPEADTIRELDEANQSYLDQGFLPPYLFKPGCDYEHIFIHDVTHNACAGSESSAPGSRVGGRFVWGNQVLTICVDPAAPYSAEALRSVVRHELFHAVAYSYLAPARVAAGPAADGLEPDGWIDEGMAEAAVDSGAAMHRVTTRALHEVGTSLLSESSPAKYQAQDFWVHLFTATVEDNRRAYPLGFLVDFLVQGSAKTKTIAAVMRHPPASRYRELGDEYWAWAKNQVFEKTDVTFDDALTNPCRLDRNRIGRPGRIAFPRDDEFRGHFETPLQTKWVAVKFRDAAHGVTIQVDGDSVAFKVYWTDDPVDDPVNCVDVADGDRWFGSLPAGAEVLVLVANKSFNTVGEYNVSVFGE